MTTEKVNDLELVKLSDYFTARQVSYHTGYRNDRSWWYYRDAGCV